MGTSKLLAATGSGQYVSGLSSGGGGGGRETWLALETVCELMMPYLHKACFQKPEIATAAA